MVKALIDTLIEIGTDKKVVFLLVDEAEVYHALYQKYPDRTFNVGIAECNAISLAAGLENGGFKPYVIGGCSFMAFRAIDFIRVQLCMTKSNVKVIGIGAGLAISILGNTQHGTEDLSVLRAMPNLKVVTPATPTEVGYAIQNVYEESGPAFIRVGRSSGEDFYKKGIDFIPNKMQMIKSGSELFIFSSGSILCDVLSVAESLSEDIGVIDVHTISPIDHHSLITYAKQCQNWMTVEEHNLNGGLGGAIAEQIVDRNLNVTLHRVGLHQHFAAGYGNYDQIKNKNGLGKENLLDQFRLALETR